MKGCKTSCLLLVGKQNLLSDSKVLGLLDYNFVQYECRRDGRVWVIGGPYRKRKGERTGRKIRSDRTGV